MSKTVYLEKYILSLDVVLKNEEFARLSITLERHLFVISNNTNQTERNNGKILKQLTCTRKLYFIMSILMY